MKKKLRYIGEILLLILIIALSVTIFLLRDRITNVSTAGYLGLIFVCFLANSTVLLPSPSLMVAASCALIMNPWLVAVCGALGSALGELVGYLFGTISHDISPRFQALTEKLTEKIRSRTLLVFILAVLPLPLFDVAGIYSGGTAMNLLEFFFVCFLGKLIKMLVYIRAYDILAWLMSIIPRLLRFPRSPAGGFAGSGIIRSISS